MYIDGFRPYIDRNNFFILKLNVLMLLINFDNYFLNMLSMVIIFFEFLTIVKIFLNGGH